MRFLGEDPKDWDDEVFVYELRFEQEPDDATLVALANAWQAHCKKGVTGRGGWRFSKEYAYLNAFPRGGDARALFADVAKFVRSAHGIAPLVEAVHITAAEDYADLDPGPPCAGSQRPRDAAYPEPAGREAFDAVFREIFEAERQARFAAAVAPPKAKCVGLAFADPTEPAAESAYPAALRALYPADDGMSFQGALSHPQRAGRYVQFYKSLYLNVNGSPHQIALPENTTCTRVSSPHPSGDCVAFHLSTVTREETVVLVDPSDGSIREVWRASAEDKKIQRTLWLTERFLAIETETRLCVIDTSEASPSVVDSRRISDCRFSLFDGRLLWAFPMKLFAWNGKKLSPAGSVKLTPLFFVTEQAGRAVFRHGKPHEPSDGDQYFELTHTAEVLAAKAAVKGATAASKRGAGSVGPAKKSKSKPGWVLVEGVQAPEPVPEAVATAARGGWSHPGNVIDALTRWGEEKNPTAVRAANADVIATMNTEGFTLARGDEVRQFENHAGKRLAITPAGSRGFGVQGDWMLHTFGPESDTPTLIYNSAKTKLGEVHDFAAIGENEVVVALAKGMVWLQRDESGTWQEVAVHKTIKKGVRVAAAGDIVAVISASASPLVVLRRDGAKIKKLCSDKDGAEDLFVASGAIHARRASGEISILQL